MKRERPKQIWVSPQFAWALKVKAAQHKKTILKLSEELDLLADTKETNTKKNDPKF